MFSHHRSQMAACGLSLLIAAGGMLVSAPGAQAARHRGAVLVKDIRPGGSPSITAIYCGDCEPPYNGGELTDVRGTLYFSANDGKHGFELWRSDGTARGTRMVKDINHGRGWSDLYGITAVNRIIYFAADDGVHGAELWRSDGTARGTRMVKDINPVVGSGGPYELTDVNGTLFFATLSDANHVSELWRSDGTEAGTTVVKSVSAVALTDFRGALYFSGPGGLWRSDGTEAGTTIVKDNIGIGTYDPLTDVNGILYFGADDGVHGSELWRSDGTEAGTTMVKDLNPGAGSSAIYLTGANGTLYFGASFGPGPIPNELWRSDGTEAGTTLVKAIFPFSLTAVKGIIYISDVGKLWRSDGTEAGTTVVRVNVPGGKNSNIGPGKLTAVGRTLYFVGSDKRHGKELWRSNGSRAGTTIVRDIHRGPGPSGPAAGPQNLTAVGDTLFFTAQDGRHGRELWRAGPPPCAKGKCKKG